MRSPPNSAWKTRLVEGQFPDRSFDIEFWQEQGDEAIFAAAWELVELTEEISQGRKPRLKELLQLINEFEVEYLIVGGFAGMKYGEPRYTKDLDIWGCNSAQNLLRLVGALKKFGAPLEHDQITPDTFTQKQIVYQIGIAPVRIDILTEITGVEFSDTWKNRVASTFFGVPVHFISQADLVANKQALGQQQRPARPQAESKERGAKEVIFNSSLFLPGQFSVQIESMGLPRQWHPGTLRSESPIQRVIAFSSFLRYRRTDRERFPDR